MISSINLELQNLQHFAVKSFYSLNAAALVYMYTLQVSVERKINGKVHSIKKGEHLQQTRSKRLALSFLAI